MSLNTALVLGQIAVYITCAVTSLTSFIPIGLTRSDFSGVCILYADITWSTKDLTGANVTNSSPMACNYIIGIGVINMLLCFFMAVLLAYFVFSRTDVEGKLSTQGSFIVMVVHACLVLLVFIAGCMISVGYKHWCSELEKKHMFSCTHVNGISWNKDYNDGDFNAYMATAQTSTWVTFFILVVLLVLTALRWWRKRSLDTGESERQPILPPNDVKS